MSKRTCHCLVGASVGNGGRYLAQRNLDLVACTYGRARAVPSKYLFVDRARTQSREDIFSQELLAQIFDYEFVPFPPWRRF